MSISKLLRIYVKYSHQKDTLSIGVMDRLMCSFYNTYRYGNITRWLRNTCCYSLIRKQNSHLPAKRAFLSSLSPSPSSLSCLLSLLGMEHRTWSMLSRQRTIDPWPEPRMLWEKWGARPYTHFTVALAELFCAYLFLTCDICQQYLEIYSFRALP